MGLAQFIVNQGLAQIRIDQVASGFQAKHQAAPAHDGGKVLILDAVSGHEIPDDLHSERDLIRNSLKFLHLGSIVLHILLNDFLRAVVKSQFVAGGARIDNQLFVSHKRLLLTVRRPERRPAENCTFPQNWRCGN